MQSSEAPIEGVLVCSGHFLLHVNFLGALKVVDGLSCEADVWSCLLSVNVRVLSRWSCDCDAECGCHLSLLLLSLVCLCECACVGVLTSVSVPCIREGCNDGTHEEICAPLALEGSFRHLGCLGKCHFNCACDLDAFLNIDGLNLWSLFLVVLDPMANEGSSGHALCLGKL